MKIQDVEFFVVWYEHQPAWKSYHKFTRDELSQAINKYTEIKADAEKNPDAVGYGIYVVPVEFREDTESSEIGEGIYNFCYYEEENPVKIKPQPVESGQMSLF